MEENALQNPEDQRRNEKIWAKRNPKRKRENRRRWRANNRERHREQTNKACRKWNKNNPDKKRAYRHRYRVSIKLSIGSFTALEWVSLCNSYHNRCLCCRKRKKLTADHVIPVSKGGSSSINNIQPLCQSCNSKKGTKSTDFRKQRG